jgi:hypothetical protein
MNTHPTPWRLRAIAAAAAAAGACPLATMAQTAPDTSVAFEPTRIVVTAPALGTLASRTLLTSVDTVGGAALQDAAVSANWELFSPAAGRAADQLQPGHDLGQALVPRLQWRRRGQRGQAADRRRAVQRNDGNMHYLDLVVPLALQSVTAVRGTNDARYGLHNIAGNLETAHAPGRQRHRRPHRRRALGQVRCVAGGRPRGRRLHAELCARRAPRRRLARPRPGRPPQPVGPLGLAAAGAGPAPGADTARPPHRGRRSPATWKPGTPTPRRASRTPSRPPTAARATWARPCCRPKAASAARWPGARWCT